MLRFGLLFILGLLLAPISAAQNVETILKCEGTVKFGCSDQGCQNIPPRVITYFNVDKKELSRCDSSGCDVFPADSYNSGIFLLLEARGRGMFLKVNTEDTSLPFVEIATAMTSVFTTYGNCEFQ